MGADAAAEEEFGPYLVYERLGVGGMATVHRALERGIEGFERVVALKRLLPNLATDTTFINAFVREAKLASYLKHVNIVQLFELGRVGNAYFISMEYIDGRDVRRILRQARKVAGPPPIHFTVGVLTQLCDALDYAHNKVDDAGQPLGLVHRDVSPSNVLVTTTGKVKVIDFGIAKAASAQLRTQTGRVKGKLAYMAPEALAGRELDARSDLFALGVIAHELLTARPLFAGKNEYQTLLKVQRGEVQPPSTFNPNCPAELDAVVLRALAREPDARFASAAALRDQLDAMRRQYGLATSERDIVTWLDWAFSLEAPRGGFTPGQELEPSGLFDVRSARPAEPRSPAPAQPDAPSQPIPSRTRTKPRRDDEEVSAIAWGGAEDLSNGQPVLLDDVPDVSEKHPSSASALGAEARVDLDDLVDDMRLQRQPGAGRPASRDTRQPPITASPRAAVSAGDRSRPIPAPPRATPTSPAPRGPQPSGALGAGLRTSGGAAPGAPRDPVNGSPGLRTSGGAAPGSPRDPVNGSPGLRTSGGAAPGSPRDPVNGSPGLRSVVIPPRIRTITSPPRAIPSASAAPRTTAPDPPVPPAVAEAVGTLPRGATPLATPPRSAPVIVTPGGGVPKVIPPAPSGRVRAPVAVVPPAPSGRVRAPITAVPVTGPARTTANARAAIASASPATTPARGVATPWSPPPGLPTAYSRGGPVDDPPAWSPPRTAPSGSTAPRTSTGTAPGSRDSARQLDSALGSRARRPTAPGTGPRPARHETATTEGAPPFPLAEPAFRETQATEPMAMLIADDLGLAADTVPQMPALPASEAVAQHRPIAAAPAAASPIAAAPPPSPPAEPRRFVTPATDLFARTEAELEADARAEAEAEAEAEAARAAIATPVAPSGSHQAAPAGPPRQLDGSPPASLLTRTTQARRRVLRRRLLVLGAILALAAAATAVILRYLAPDPVPLPPPGVPSAPPPAQAVATVEFDVIPADATIAVASLPVHAGSPWQIELAPGAYQVEISRDGYLPMLTSITVSAGETRPLRVELQRMTAPVEAAPEPSEAPATGSATAPPEPAPPPPPPPPPPPLAAQSDAWLSVKSTPPGLEVVLDGVPLETVTPFRLPIRPGRHTLVLRSDGAEVWRTQVDATAGSSHHFTPAIAGPDPDEAAREPAAPAAPAAEPRQVPPPPSQDPAATTR